MASGSVSKIHVLTADYRGFGYSTGTPTESGLIIDGIALVSWALEIAQIPPERIVLVGHSLGTAVATAVVEHFTVQHHVDFAGVVLVAAFLDLPTLMLTYSGGGIVPLLSPLQAYPPLQQYLLRHFKDRWHTCSRLINMVRQSEKLNLVLIHALDDKNIPWTHSSDLFFAAANATSNSDLTKKQIDGVKQHVYLGHQGWTNTWSAGSGENGLKRIQQIVLKHGGKCGKSAHEFMRLKNLQVTIDL
ncbi:hypothetical protein MMC19_006296 [Ptychographa xylographoides]|nr:hypothetical protein [Ptychographa xylographoides]